MATAGKLVYSHVTKQPGVRGGKACIDDTRISVADVVALLKQGLDDRQIIERYPSLSLAQVHAAVSYYYYENPDELAASQVASGKPAATLPRRHQGVGLRPRAWRISASASS